MAAVEEFQTGSGFGGVPSDSGRRDGSVRGLPRSGIGGISHSVLTAARLDQRQMRIQKLDGAANRLASE